MLTLKRNVGQKIIITTSRGEVIEITYKGHGVMGFRAPHDVTIDREEIHYKRRERCAKTTT